MIDRSDTLDEIQDSLKHLVLSPARSVSVVPTCVFKWAVADDGRQRLLGTSPELGPIITGMLHLLTYTLSPESWDELNQCKSLDLQSFRIPLYGEALDQTVLAKIINLRRYPDGTSWPIRQPFVLGWNHADKGRIVRIPTSGGAQLQDTMQAINLHIGNEAIHFAGTPLMPYFDDLLTLIHELTKHALMDLAAKNLTGNFQ